MTFTHSLYSIITRVCHMGRFPTTNALKDEVIVGKRKSKTKGFVTMLTVMAQIFPGNHQEKGNDNKNKGRPLMT